MPNRLTLPLVGAAFLLAASCLTVEAAELITFDDLDLPPLGDVTTQYAAKGVTFKGITDAGDEVNLEVADSSVFGDNVPPSLPYSLSNFYGDDPGQRAHIMRILFSKPADGISFMYNGAGGEGASTVFNAYDSAGTLLSSFTAEAAIDSEFHPVRVPNSNVSRLEIVNPVPGWGHYIDNLEFTAAPPCGEWVTFDDLDLPPLGDVTTQYAAKGVTFKGITDAGDEVNLEVADNGVFPDNNPPSHPYSLSNFYNDDPSSRAHIMRLEFDPPTSGIRFMYNGAGDSGARTAFDVYDSAGTLLGSFNVAAATDGDFHPVSVPHTNVSRVEIVNPQPGWGHYIDNLRFGCTNQLPALTIKNAVAVSWPSELNELYQVQWASSVEPATWLNLGAPVTGHGGMMAVYDTVLPGTRIYRLTSPFAPLQAGIQLASPSPKATTNPKKEAAEAGALAGAAVSPRSTPRSAVQKAKSPANDEPPARLPVGVKTGPASRKGTNAPR